MKNKRTFVPRFINALDKYLLLNKPDTWSARTHLVLYYGLLFIMTLTLVCFLLPDDPRRETVVFVWSFLVGILSAIGFIIWLIYLLRFNVFKRFGIVTQGDKIKIFVLYFINTGIMVGAVFVPPIVESIKANHAYGNEEIVQDINNINLAVCRLNYDSIPHKWTTDTVLVKDKLTDNVKFNDEGNVVVGNHANNFHETDTTDFRIRKDMADSMLKLNDSLFVFYHCPIYTFVTTYGNAGHANTSILHSVDIYNKVIRKPEPVDTGKTKAVLMALLEKYHPMSNSYGVDENNNYESRINAKYGLFGVISSINNITERKYRWKGIALQVSVRVFCYITLIITLLVFIFRHSTVKTFFLSILSGIILLILTSLFSVFLDAKATDVFICSIGYFLVFLGLACTCFYSKTRSVISGIGLNLTVFFTAFFPLVVTGLYYQLLRDADRLRDHEIYNPEKYKIENLHYFYAEIAGVLLLLVLIETIFKKFYRTWYALPEQ
jgi:MFS family permease